jgi:hypothetical protein
MKIEFTKEEATALIQLIDVAVKQLGLGAAKAAVILSEKIENSAKETEETKEETTTNE